MVKARRYGLMGANMTVSGQWVKPMAKVGLCMQMAMST